jgi:hypothetical protein
MDDRELQLIQAFVAHAKRERYAGFLGSPKRRDKFLRELHHFRDFVPGYLVEVKGQIDSSAGLLAELRRRGAPDECHIVSAQRRLDGATRPLAEAISEIFGRVEGTLVCCIPGTLAYYEGEAPKNRFILDRRPMLRRRSTNPGGLISS